MVNALFGGRVSLAEANRFGQQTFLADMFYRANSRRPRSPIDIPGKPPPPVRPVDYRQLVLFPARRDLAAGAARGFGPPPDPVLDGALWAVAGEHADLHGWSVWVLERTRRALRILLALQDTPGASILASDVAALSAIGLPVRPTSEVLASVGMLVDDRVPAIVRWFGQQVADLPEQIRTELGVWFDVARNGSSTPPRFRPRSEATVKSQLDFALPTIRVWAATHPSLREISRDDVRAALPPSGAPRSTTLQGLRSIFRVLRARKLVFVNPTVRISVPNPARTAPDPIDLVSVRDAFNSDDPTRAALAALLAFHAPRVRELRHLRLTDARDGRLHLPNRVVPLAAPARDRLAAYLDYRQRTWPNTANPYLFVHYRNATTTTPVTPWWIGQRLGMAAQSIRMDRILDEAHASGGDIRMVAELFGLSVAGAYRYITTVDHPDIRRFEHRGDGRG